MNLWINSRATHWTGDGDLHSVYCVMDGAFRLTEWVADKDAAIAVIDKINSLIRRAA